MTVYIGLLRAVNLGGSTRVSMAALQDRIARNGFEKVHTLLQSGNVVLSSDQTNPSAIERTLERLAQDELGLSTDFFVRSAQEWHAILLHNPFTREAAKDPAHLVVTTLKRAPSAQEWGALQASIPGRERVEGSGREAYIVYPDGIGTSRLTPALIERKLGTRGTSRNWNTVRKLDQLASA